MSLCRLGVASLCALTLIVSVGVSESAAATPCPNEALRTGPSAGLPDCRAYELVTPPDSNGRLVEAFNTFSLPATFQVVPSELVSLVGDGAAFNTYQSALQEASGGSGVADAYEAERQADGWETTRRMSLDGVGSKIAVPQGISPDHRYSFNRTAERLSPLSVGGSTEYLSGPGGSLELVGVGSMGKEPFAQGRFLSEGGKHVVFSTGHDESQSILCWLAGSACEVRQLEPEAAPTGTGAVYDREVGGATHVVSLLPGEVPLKAGEEAHWKGTSKDGSATAFEAKGNLYVRLDDRETKEVASGSPTFAGVSDDGGYVFYVVPGGFGEAGVIHRFDTASGADALVDPGDEGTIVNVSGDGSHVYFASKRALTGGEENGQGEAAVPPARGAGTLDFASGSGNFSEGSEEVTGLSTGAGEFKPGMEIEVIGARVQPGTVITAVGPGTLTLSKPADFTAASRSFSAGSKEVTGVTTSEGEFEPGMAIEGVGIPEGTTVTAVGPGTLTLSRPPTHNGSVELSAGVPNLYVWSAGSTKYITTVLPSDLVQTSDAGNGVPGLGDWTAGVANRPKSNGEYGPGNDSSRTTPDGSAIVFESKAQLTPYENEEHTEIYRYDEAEDSLLCVSCNPAGGAPSGEAQLQDLIVTPASNILHNLSEDGSRVFFETDEALVGEDTDGANDIYEWQEGEAGGAQLSLISSGKSSGYPYPPGFSGLPTPNVLFSVTPDGDNVLFIAEDALTPGAPEGGASAIYDARVDGGFPPPGAPPACLEEGCKPPATSSGPSLSSPGSETLQGGGNLRPRRRHRRHCRRHRRHGRCKAKPRHHRAGHKKARVSASGSVSAPAQPAAGGSASAGAAPGSPSAAGPAAAPGAGDAEAAAAGGSPVAAAVEPPVEYGIEKVSAGLSTTAAGGHPDFSPDVLLDHIFKEDGRLSENMDRTEEVAVSLPPGLIGNINAVPRCSTGQLVAVSCPTDSQVGITNLYVTWVGPKFTEPVYNLTPPHPDSEVARFGFTAGLFPTFIDVHVRTAGDYGITATVSGSSGLVSLVGAETILWGEPANPIHDKQRLTPTEATQCTTACEAPGGERPSTIPVAERKSFMSNPSACQSGSVGFAVKSYQLATPLTASAPLPAIDHCQGLPFSPRLEARPTTDVAAAPTGLKSAVVIPQHPGEGETASATMREARVTLPEGMTINPAAADGLAGCSDSQVHFHEEADAQCPSASKLGLLEIKSPDLPRPLEGAVYQRSPQGKGNLFGLWLVSDELGLHIKIPGQVRPDPATGRLTAVFSDLPQVPAEEIDLDIWGGARAPLKNPDTCGTYTTTSLLYPHSQDPPASPSDTFVIDRGPGGGSCASSPGQEPDSPGFSAGTARPIAAAYSPMAVKLHREDGSQPFGALDLTLPPGLLGKLSGVAECPDGSLAAAAQKSGAEEQAAPSCPAASLLGSVSVAAGAGPSPFWTKGQAYLAGPYKGAPLSLAVITPAVAGPFDLGTVVVRSALYVDPETARITVKSDPLPTILEGVPLNLRAVVVQIDREDFTRNGTSCEPLGFAGILTSVFGNPAPLAARFQLAECAALAFRPKLTLKLRGKSTRRAHPALRAVLRMPAAHQADIARAQVTLPRAEFLDQSHIHNVCTQVQFKGRGCPKDSVLGHAAAYSPLLEKPLSGPVYLMTGFGHELPDIAADLNGQIRVLLHGKVDVGVTGGIRTTFEVVPDAPVTKFVLSMDGGRKGLLVNSEDTCARPKRAIATFTAYNGRVVTLRPLPEAGCPKRGKHRHHKHRGRAPGHK